MKYECRIEDGLLCCAVTADRDLRAPVFCCSGMAPMEVANGGEMVRELGGYLEVQLPDLAAGVPHEFVIRYGGGFKAGNRAWMPLGPYLRAGGAVIELPSTRAGRDVPDPVEAGPFRGLPLVPQPLRWVAAGGVVDVDGVVVDDAALGAVAQLAQRQGMRFAGPMPVRIVTGDLAEDAYRLDIMPEVVVITAGSRGGRFYAGITLLTLLQQGPLPLGTIEDAPRFAWRGQHLDTARHYYEPETIMALLDLMALLKLNRFHWHFADDEAFRLEIDSVPELWQKTVLRGEGQVLPGLFAGAPVQGGSYSKDVVRRIIDHARALNIEVMPEVEVPAHALALTTLFPETRDPDDQGRERSVQGYPRNVVNPAQPRTWELLEAVVTEVGALFPFGVVHLGCDELPADTWMGSPMARALMEDHGLKTTQDLLGWMICKLAGTVVANGQRPAAWEEAAQGAGGGIGHGAILFSWTGQGPGQEAARAGYDVVMTPAQHLYFDMAHSTDVDDWGANWAACFDLEDTIAWDPVPDPALADRIIGVQGAFWSEFTTQDAQMWPMLMPRILGLSAMAWQKQAPGPEDVLPVAGLYRVGDDGRVSL